MKASACSDTETCVGTSFSPQSRSQSASSFSSRTVGSHSDVNAVRHECLERLRVVEKKTILDHANVIFFERLQPVAGGHKPQLAINRRPIIDQCTVRSFLGEEHSLVTRNRIRQLAVCESGCREASLVQPGNIMPMACDAIAAKTLLKTENVDGSRFLPERSLRMHHTWLRRRKGHALDKSRCVAADLSQARPSIVHRTQASRSAPRNPSRSQSPRNR